MTSFIINIVLLLACVVYLALDLYLECKHDAEKLHEEVQKLIKEHQNSKEL